MRELKFRAFDVNRQLMHNSVLPIMSDAFVLFGGMGEHTVCGTLQKGVIMQFTGLKDKNGKEIYEGDVVTLNGYQPKEVEWVNCRSYTGFNIGGTQKGKKEVVGNIYENPELLK